MSGEPRRIPPRESGAILDIPRVHVSAVVVRCVGNEVLVNCEQWRGCANADGVFDPSLARLEHTAELFMSIQTLKDLILAMAYQLRLYEEKLGPVRTQYADATQEAAGRALGDLK